MNMMVKRLFVALLVALTINGASAKSREYFAWGVEAGMNFNKLSFARSDFESSNRMGFFFGPKVKVKVPLLGLGADAAVLYSLNSSRVIRDIEGAETSLHRNLSYLEIPLNLRYNFDLRILNLYLATGPQYDYCLSSQGSIEELYGPQLDNFSRSTWGWNIGAGIDIAYRFQIGITYTIPISDSGRLKTADLSNVITKFSQKTVKVRLAYYF